MNGKFVKNILKGNLILTLVCTLVETIVFSLGFVLNGLLRGDVFNYLAGSNTFFNLDIKIIILLMAIIPITINITKQINQYFLNVCKIKIANSIKRSLFKTLLSLSNNNSIHGTSGEVLTRFREDTQDIVDFLMIFSDYFPTSVLSVGALVVMLKISIQYTLICFIPMVIVIIIVRTLQKKITIYRRKSKEATTIATDKINIILTSIELLKLSNKDSGIIKNYEKALEKKAKAVIKDEFLQTLLQNLSSNMLSITLGVILLIGLSSFSNGTFTIGDFVVFEYYYWFLAPLSTTAGNVMQKYKNAKIAYERLMTICGGLTNETSLISHQNGTVSSEGYTIYVTKNDIYIPKLKVGTKIDLQPRERVLIYGRTGSGKSTALRDLVANDKDNIFCISDKKSGTAKMQPNLCSYVMQVPHLFYGSLRDNICMSGKYNENMMKQVVYLSALDQEFEQGVFTLETQVGADGGKLSGGQRKRIALARALYKDAPVLIIDDLSSGLDIITESLIWERLMKQSGRTIIVTSNQWKHTKYADCVINLESGQVYKKDEIPAMEETSL